jgi:hypothetical protein
MSRCHAAGSKIFLDKQERKANSLGLCVFILNYWPLRQLCHYKFYYYKRNPDSIKISLLLTSLRTHTKVSFICIKYPNCSEKKAGDYFFSELFVCYDNKAQTVHITLRLRCCTFSPEKRAMFRQSS